MLDQYQVLVDAWRSDIGVILKSGTDASLIAALAILSY